MLTLSAKIRKDLGKKVRVLRKKGILPGILYGPKIKKAIPLEVPYQVFEKVYQEAGESSLISLEIDKNKALVLIHQVELDPLSNRPSHVDFYQPSLESEVEVRVPLVFEGEAPAAKDLGGTLIKNISEVEVRALAQELPHEIRVNLKNLKTFEDNILIKDLELPERVKILKEPEEIVAVVVPPEKVEEELARPIEEKVGEVERVEEKKEEKTKE